MMTIQESDSRKRVWELMTWIREHLEESITVAALARQTGLSARHFYRLFKQVAGEPPSEHVQRLRLARGAAWLAYTDAPVIEAALIAGYESREAFTRLFSKHFNCTPKVFRKRFQEHLCALRAMSAPKGLRIVGVEQLPSMALVAWPHMGPYVSSFTAWIALGTWAKAQGLLGAHARPVCVIYDDGALLCPQARERYDAALAFDPDATPPDANEDSIRYHFPGGRFIIAEYTGALAGIDAAWDYFALVWFVESGYQMRDSRMLTLFEPADIPVSTQHAARLLTRKRMNCRLCIPVDSIAGDGLPTFNGHRRRSPSNAKIAQ